MRLIPVLYIVGLRLRATNLSRGDGETPLRDEPTFQEANETQVDTICWNSLAISLYADLFEPALAAEGCMRFGGGANGLAPHKDPIDCHETL